MELKVQTITAGVLCVVMLMPLYAETATVVQADCTNERFAVCDVKKNPSEGQDVSGIVTFRQCYGGDIEIDVDLSGFDPADPSTNAALHGFHVHEFGNTTQGCGSTGGHYNPGKVDHGGPEDDVRHPGDFGNLRQTADGKIRITFTDRFATLFDEDTIIGRAIVVHAGVDDLGRGGNQASRDNGNAGPRLGCCVIGISQKWI